MPAPQLLYQEETDAFLKAFILREQNVDKKFALDAVRMDMVQAFRDAAAQMHVPNGHEEHPALHPVSLAKRLLHKRHLVKDDEEFGKISEILEKTYPRDEVTGFYAKQCMPVMVGLAHLAASAHGNNVPISLVEGDFANMGGCNKTAIGREGTDKLIHAICHLLEGSFQDYAREHGQKVEVVGVHFVETHGIRAGGDEVRLVVFGLKPEQVQEVLRERVHPRVNLLAAEFGVHQAPHEKKGKTPGFGAAFASVDLTRETDPARIRKLLDAGIENQKLNDGLLRMGVTDDAGVERYMREVYEPYLATQKLPPDVHAEHMRDFRPPIERKAAELAQQWREMTRDGPYPPELRKGAGKNPRDFFNDYSKQHAPGVEAKLAGIHLTPVDTRVPFAGEIVSNLGEAPESLRLRRVMKALDFPEIAQKALFSWNKDLRRYELQRTEAMKLKPERARVLRLAIDLMQQYDALDPASRCKAPQLLPEDSKDYIERHGTSGMKVLQFELGNVNGLNGINYDLADAVLRETGKYIQDGLFAHQNGLGTNIMDHVYHEGGGKFKVLLPPDYPQRDIDAVAQYVNEKLETHVRSQPVLAFAKATYANPSNGREAGSLTKLDALHDRVMVMEAATGKTIDKVGDIPHPKDSGKTLTFKHYATLLHVGETVDDRGIVDTHKMAKALEAVSAKAEIEFNRSAQSGIKKTG